MFNVYFNQFQSLAKTTFRKMDYQKKYLDMEIEVQRMKKKLNDQETRFGKRLKLLKEQNTNLSKEISHLKSQIPAAEGNVMI